MRTTDLSYVSRLATAEELRRAAWPELDRPGIETAGVVCAVPEGADWLPSFVSVFRPDAVRILDFPHAAEDLSAAAQAVFGAGTAVTSEWLGTPLHELKHGDPEQVLAAVAALPVERAALPAAATTQRATTLAYLEKRRAQIRYADFQAAGYPIGSGIVESANKLVVEARLKGSGRRWVRPNVDPLVALRSVACSDRWADLFQSPALMRCPPGADRTDPWQALRENRARTPAIRTAKASDLDAQDNRSATEGKVGESALVPTVDTPRRSSTHGTASAASGRANPQDDQVVLDADLLQPETD